LIRYYTSFKKKDAPGTEVILEARRPAVQLSAVEIEISFSTHKSCSC
jgi:hypothetical protein